MQAEVAERWHWRCIGGLLLVLAAITLGQANLIHSLSSPAARCLWGFQKIMLRQGELALSSMQGSDSLVCADAMV